MHKLYREKIIPIIWGGSKNIMIKNIIFGCVVSLLTFGLISTMVSKTELAKKDCMIAEHSPDFTVKEKELCKELRRK